MNIHYHQVSQSFLMKIDNLIVPLSQTRKAVEYFDDEKLELEAPVDRFSLPEELQEVLSERVKALNNLALCQMKIEAHESALNTLKQVLKVEVRVQVTI